jgi:hypothetical protein
MECINHRIGFLRMVNIPLWIFQPIDIRRKQKCIFLVKEYGSKYFGGSFLPAICMGPGPEGVEMGKRAIFDPQHLCTTIPYGRGAAVVSTFSQRPSG